MRVSIRVPLATTPEQAADMLLDPTALNEVGGADPATRPARRDLSRPLDPGRRDAVRARALGLVPVGDQSIRISVWDHGRRESSKTPGAPSRALSRSSRRGGTG